MLRLLKEASGRFQLYCVTMQMVAGHVLQAFHSVGFRVRPCMMVCRHLVCYRGFLLRAAVSTWLHELSVACTHLTWYIVLPAVNCMLYIARSDAIELLGPARQDSHPHSGQSHRDSVELYDSMTQSWQCHARATSIMTHFNVHVSTSRQQYGYVWYVVFFPRQLPPIVYSRSPG